MSAFRKAELKKPLWCKPLRCSLYSEQAKEWAFCFYSNGVFATCAQFLIEIQI